MYEKIFLFIKEKFNKFLAYRIIAALLPNRAVFSANPVIVSIANADLEFKTAAFKRAVVNRNEKIVKMLMVRSDINDYFLLSYGFKIEDYDKKYIKNKAVKYKNFEIMMNICKNYHNFRAFSKDEIKIAARVKIINWDKLYKYWGHYPDLIIEALKVKPIPVNKDLLFKNVFVAEYLLRIYKYAFTEEDQKEFMNSAQWARLALKFKLVDCREIIVKFLLDERVNVLKYCEGVILTKKQSEKAVSDCRIYVNSGRLIKLLEIGCISLTGSEIFEKFHWDPLFICDLKKYIDIEMELKKYLNMEEEYIAEYLKFLKKEKLTKLIWEEDKYFHNVQDMETFWLQCL